MRLFVFGLGYSALATACLMRNRLNQFSGTSRSAARVNMLQQAGIDAVIFDGHGPSDGVGSRLPGIDHILHSIAPPETGDPVLAFHGRNIAEAQPEGICYLSTVGVYGDHDGGLVSEDSPCRPASERSRRRLRAEADWKSFCDEHEIPLAILRLAGIYGPGRGPFEKLRAGTSRRIVKPDQVFNRIHVEDIAQIAEAAMSRNADGIFNCGDDLPAPPQEVISHAAGLLGLEPPAEEPFDEADLSPMARSFYGENKRVDNSRIKSELGITLKYPTYREGLAAILDGEGRA